jgi:citrate synthase
MMLYQLLGKPQHQELLSELEAAHFRAALSNENTSSAVAVAVYRASGDIGKAIAAASLAQGGLHAPLAQARALLDAYDLVSKVRNITAAKERVPGFGNSFYKDRIDPAFQKLFEMLPPSLRGDLLLVQHNIDQYPNAASITAAAAMAAGLPAGIEPAIFIYCRTPAWIQLCLKCKTPKVATL